MKNYVMELLDLANVTYEVSNKGKEIRFSSDKNESDVKDVIIYPPTGTYTYYAYVSKVDRHLHDAVKMNIRRCLDYHLNFPLFRNKNKELVK